MEKRNPKKENYQQNIPFEQRFLHFIKQEFKDNRPIGKILGDAVMSSVQTLLMIGGFIILFSVVNKLLFHLQITGFFAKAIEVALTIFQLPIELSIPLISGLFEITLGTQLISQIQRRYFNGTSHHYESYSWF